jgi:nicotinate-nucleotide pyrophosphorylase (carboxylating)
MKLRLEQVKDLINTSIEEDIGTGDITTRGLIPPTQAITARFVAQQTGIISGLSMAQWVYKILDKRCVWRSRFSDGDRVKKGQTVATVRGLARAVLTGERTSLNFLTHMSGIATLTRRFVEEVKNTGTKICDTRKTTPGLRLVEKYAVTCGGGQNIRMGLYDMAMIKDNHIKVCHALGLPMDQLVKSLYSKIFRGTEVEFETQNLRQVELALKCDVDIIMLDNMTYKMLRKAVKIIRKTNKTVQIEVSGGINLKNVGKISRLDIDRISVGSLTHSVPSLDISLDIDEG